MARSACSCAFVVTELTLFLTLDAPGKPILFGTTDQFLRNFGISSSADLPELSAVEKEDFRAEAEAELAAGEDVSKAEQIRVEV